MPDQEVIINDSSLNAIANAIRRKNGLVRTYKPREMAPAIRAIGATAPDARNYTVTIIQSPHQHITVKQYLGGEKVYSDSFTLSEPYWKIQATVEPDPGYTAGLLNHAEEITLDRDITISANPATIQTFDDPVDVYWYVKDNSREAPLQPGDHFYANLNNVEGQGIPLVFGDPDCELYGENASPRIQGWGFARPFLRCHFIDRNDRRTLYMNHLFCQGHWSCLNRLNVAKEVIQDINTAGVVSMQQVLNLAPYLEIIDLSNWDVSSVETMDNFILECERLKTIGDISNWNPINLRTCNNFLGSCGSREMTSLDVSGWNTPLLESATNFVGGRIKALDISNWDTTKLTAFSFTSSMEYLIMDKEEIKFSGSFKCPHPNNTMKYLVPLSMVNDYKQHPNWSAWANQIDSVTNYTINRGGGKVIVVPNY